MSKIVTKDDILKKAKVLMEKKQELKKINKNYDLLKQKIEKEERDNADLLLEQI